MDASLETALALSAELSKWFDSSIHGLQIPSSNREAMAGALFDQVHEHHKAVHLLLKNSFSGSAFSLVRPMFETFVRGLWLRRCAPDQAIEKFKKDKLELKFELLIDEIEKQPDYRRAVLSKIKKQAWKTMCSYAHGGLHQAVNRLTSGFIQPRYAEGAKVEVVNFSSAVALLSAAEIFSMARRQDLMEQALERVRHTPLVSR